MEETSSHNEKLPYKIVDGAREKRFGVVASSLQELVTKACEKLSLAQTGCGGLKVVLEQDGTEVDEEDYFNTLEKNTTLMLLTNEQYWQPSTPFRRQLDVSRGSIGDTVDGGRGLEGLLSRLQSDIGHVSLLGGCELELLSDMDPDSLTDIVPDRTFLDQLKEASGRLLSDKRQAHEAMELLKLYHQTTNDSTTTSTNIQPDPKRGTKAQ